MSTPSHPNPSVEERWIREYQEAIDKTPDFVREHLAAGKQFNCYDSVRNDEEGEDDPDDREFYLCVGPISDARHIMDVDSQWRADLLSCALRIAESVRRAKSQPEQASTPDDDGWIEWHGGECPVLGDRVELRFRDGTTSTPSAAALWSWSNRNRYDDIIAYRPVQS